MTLRFRKRVKVLPGIYLNIGKTGVSTSIGPRGLNINIGQSGIYLNTGIPGTGISNREKLFDWNNKNPDANLTLPDNRETTLLSNEINSIETAPKIITSEGLEGLREQLEQARKERQLLASEIKEEEYKLNDLQSTLSKKQNGLLSKLFASKESVDNLSKEVESISKDLEELKKLYNESQADININFDSELETQYSKVATALTELLNTKMIWNITQQSVNTESKSWAKSIVDRKEVKFKFGSLDFIKSKYLAFILQNANGNDLYIYPAFVIIIHKNGEFSLIDMRKLLFDFYKQQFQEQKEAIPLDAKITDYTWYKVNKDGSRDMRYAGNFQIPIVEYGAFNLRSSNGINEKYQISNIKLANNFANEFKTYLSLINYSDKSSLSKTNLGEGKLSTFQKQYYDLLKEFSPQVVAITKKIANDETIIKFVKDRITEDKSVESTCYHNVVYDCCQILKILSKDKIDSGSLETTGLVLLSYQLKAYFSRDFLSDDFETISKCYTTGIYKDAASYYINIAKEDNPIGITMNIKENNKLLSTDEIKNVLAFPSLLKAIDHPLFDEYATTLYRFATILAKVDNVISKDEEKILNGIFQITHHPLPELENKSFRVSKVNEKETLDQVLDELNTLIGLKGVKQEVKSLINYIKVQQERKKVGLKSSQVSYHCVFTGSPGTGKTTIARLIAKIYMHLGVLTKGHLVETDRSGLVAEYTGQTAVKVNKTVDSAIDGVLFIDEAYSLVGLNQDDFGKEAVATLIKRMEDDRDKLIVILAGYTQEMKTFIESNPGFKSRFNRYIEFVDFSPSEMEAIFKLKCNQLDYKFSADAEKKLVEVLTTAFNNRDKSFGNGRFVRNIFEKTIEKQANRIASVSTLTKEILTTITADDIPLN